MIRLLSVIVSFILCFNTGAAVSYKPAESGITMSAVILSDIHIEGNNFERYPRFAKILNGVYGDEHTPEVIAFAGDNTMNGQNIEWFDFYGYVNRYCGKSDVLVAAGNHDFGNTSDSATYDELSERFIKSYNYYCRKSIDCVYYSEDVNGVRFIVMGSEANAENTVEVITDKQIDFISSELSEASAADMPVVIINHNLLYGRNGDRSLWDFNQLTECEKLDSVLQSAGTEVIYVSGHSHYGISDDSLTTDGNVTYINLPSAGNVDNYDADGDYADCGIGLNIEFYEDEIILSFRNFITGVTFSEYDTVISL